MSWSLLNDIQYSNMSQFIVVLVPVLLQLELCFGFPERGGYDVTDKVKKQTIYIESMIHSGWWLASTFEDRGNSSSSHEIIRDVVGKKSSKKSVFHPGKPFRFEGVDCGSGYVCLRSRFQETNHSDHNSTQDASSFYLGIYNQAGFLDGMRVDDYYVKLFHETRLPTRMEDHLKWKIKCWENLGLHTSAQCNLFNKDKERQLEMYLDGADGVEEKSMFKMRPITRAYNLKVMKPLFTEERKALKSNLKFYRIKCIYYI